MFDLLIWGATGFTGTLCAEYLVKVINNGETKDERTKKLSWAIGGRNLTKLVLLKEKLVKLNSSCSDVGIVVSNINDRKQLEELIKQTKVVINTAGPFNLYASPIVDVCVRNGIHYVDITGEPHWVKKMVNSYHEEAVKNNSIIVNCCGLDSLPADMLTFLACDAVKTLGEEVKQVSVYMEQAAFTPSGGSLATMFEMFNSPKSTIKELDDPYLISEKKGSDKTDMKRFHFDSLSKKWVGASFLAQCDGKVARRSNQFNNYGRNFSWSEYSVYPGFISGILTSIFLAFFAIIIQFSLIRGILKKFVPQPGEGPSKVEMKKGRFSAYAFGISSGQVHAKASVYINGDPAYLETATMISECGLALALDKERLPQKGGILTPASAFGHVIIDRLRNAGHKYEVEVKK